LHAAASVAAVRDWAPAALARGGAGSDRVMSSQHSALLEGGRRARERFAARGRRTHCRLVVARGRWMRSQARISPLGVLGLRCHPSWRDIVEHQTGSIVEWERCSIAGQEGCSAAEQKGCSTAEQEAGSLAERAAGREMFGWRPAGENVECRGS